MKEYSIRINGVEESINQVKQLIEQLNNLEASINTLENKSIKVNVEGVVQTAVTTSTTSSGSRTGELQQEDALLKQIAQTEEKIATARREEYKDLIQQKDVLKEVTSDAKERAAAERLAGEGYANTMRGLKAELKDIKTVMQTTDLGDEKFQSLVERANKLQLKLLEIEKSYSQFGRQVGNYPSAAEGFKALALEVAGTTREFDNAKQALMALKKERDTLAVKQDQGLVLSEEELARFNELVQLVPQLQSSIQDAGKPMDNLMDSMESFVALASAGKGLSAFFGLDGGEIDKTMKDLLALQNALKGIQTIQKQLQTVEGIGKWFKAGSDAVDKFTSKLFGLEKATKTVTTAEKAQAAATSTVANAEKAATAGATAQTAANGALTTSLTASNIAAKALSFTLKTLGIGLILTVIAGLVEGFKHIAEELKNSNTQADILQETLRGLEYTYKTRSDMLSASFMSGAMSSEEFLTQQYKLQNEYIAKEIELLQERLALENREKNAPQLRFMENFSQNSYSGGVLSAETNIESYNWWGGSAPAMKLTVKNIKEVEEEYKKCKEAAAEGKDYFEKWGSGITGFTSSLFASVKDTKRMMQELGSIGIQDLIGRFQQLNKKAAQGKITQEEFQKEIKKLVNEMNSSEMLKSVLLNLDKYIPSETVRELIQKQIDKMQELNDTMNQTTPEQIHYWNQVRIDGMKEGSAKIKAQLDEDERYEIEQTAKTEEQKDAIHQKYQRKREKELKEHNEKMLQKQKEYAKKAEEQENELNRIRIARMKEGLNKQLAQLEEERRLKLSKLKVDSELYLETNAYYDERIEDAKKKHAEQIVKIEEEMYSKLHKLELDNLQKQLDLQERGDEEIRRRFESGEVPENLKGDIFERVIEGYFSQGVQKYSIPNLGDLPEAVQKKLGVVSTQVSEEVDDYKDFIAILKDTSIAYYNWINKKKEYELKAAETNKLIAEEEARIAEDKKRWEDELKKLEEDKNKISVEKYKKWTNDVNQEIKKLETNITNLNEELKKVKDEENKAKEEYDDSTRKFTNKQYYLDAKYGDDRSLETQNKLIDEAYSKSLSQAFEYRITIIENFWNKRKEFEVNAAEELYEKEREVEVTAYQKRLEDLGLEEEAFRKQLEQLEKHLEELNGAERKEHEVLYGERKELYQKLYGTDKKAGELELALQEEHIKNLQALEEKKNEKLRQFNQEYFQYTLQELRDFQSATEQLVQRQPVMNAFGIINLKQTKKNNDEIREAYYKLFEEIKDAQKKLKEESGNLSKEAYDSFSRELDAFISNLTEKLKDVGTNFGDFWQGVDTWLQQAGQTFNSIYQSLAEITNNYYQGEIDKQQEYIDKYAELLQKQQEKTQEYADNVNSIENELANARGSRRQSLIAQLNAELAAQRASLAQEKQIEAEKQKAEEKRKDLENEQARKRKKADEIQAYINALMAVSMAAVNKWPIPALPMIAMATAVGAAQVAAIKSQPVPTYGEGGVIQGKSHAAGGVKVLGGRAEVEGGEFITNKRTTINNVELLEYINTKKRKLNIDDFIDFYSGKAVKKNIQTARTKFANGGQIPTLRTDIDLGNKLIDAFEDYAERPSIVQVVDIIDRIDNINQVQAMAGLG